MAHEEWRDVVGYEGYYQVSNLGRVRSLDRYISSSRTKPFLIRGCIIQGDCKNGRRRVALRMNEQKRIRSKRFHVDVLVAQAFIKNDGQFKDVIHIDGDITNNRADNLMWGAINAVHVYDSSAHEEWRDVVGYEGLYQVSSVGRVKSLSSPITSANGDVRITNERIMKQTLNAYGYPQLTLHKNGDSKLCRTHRLVAQAFIPNPNNLPVVDHINAIRNDNRVENLRWVTTAENVQHAVELGHIQYEKLVKVSKTDKSVKKRLRAVSKRVIRDDGKIYQSQIDAARDLGLKSCTSIRKVLSGLQQSCKGHTFKYL